MADGELYAAFQRINTIIFAQGLSLGSEDYFTVRKLCVEGMKAAQEAGSPPADVVGDLLAELKDIARRIDRDSGSPRFTAKQHDRLQALITKTEAAQLPGKGDAVASEPVYIVRRDSADGPEVDCFTDHALAMEWAKRIGSEVEEEFPIDRQTLTAMAGEQEADEGEVEDLGEVDEPGNEPEGVA